MTDTNKERIGWYMYDWANSAFYTTVITVFLGPYLTAIASNASDKVGYIYPLGIPVFHGSYFAYVVSLSVLLQVFILPLLGSIADYSKSKKFLLILFAYIGSLATASLFFVQGNDYILGGILFIVANLSFGISVVMYNAFLNDISNSKNVDLISSIGWSIGYLGGGLLLLINLILFSNSKTFNISEVMAVRICLCSAGLWWGLFTIFPAIWLKSRENIIKLPKDKTYFSIGFKKFFETLKSLKKYPLTLYFLIAYLLYNDGVQTVIVVASQFGKEEIGLKIATLTQVILIVQFVAFFGGLFFNKLAKISSAKISIIITLIIWTIAIIFSYKFLANEMQFYCLGITIGFIMGGTQALSRSIFSQLIPIGKEAEYFSLYEISDKGTSWLGPLLFGLALQYSTSYRLAILSLIIFFIIGLVMLLKFNFKEAKLQAGNIY